MGSAGILRRILTVAIGVAAAATAANAALLDFTDTSGAGAPGTMSGDYEGTSYSLSASGPIWFNPVQDGATCAVLACIGDGLGVGDDEVSAPYFFLTGDVLRIDFGTAIEIDGVYLLDLYSSYDGVERELARVTYNGGSVDIFADPAETPGDSGFLAFLFTMPITTNYLEFTAPQHALTRAELGRNDFAVAGVLATPLPAALPLFGTGLGLIGLMGWLRRRRLGTA